MILVNSLPDDEFMFMKESLYAKDLSKSFPKFLDVLQDMQNFDLNKQKATLKLESPVPPGPTILSAPHPSPSESNVLSATRCSIKLCAETGRSTPTAIRATPRPAMPMLPPLPIRLLRKY
jgi:hypothetical protein